MNLQLKSGYVPVHAVTLILLFLVTYCQFVQFCRPSVMMMNTKLTVSFTAWIIESLMVMSVCLRTLLKPLILFHMVCV